MFKNQIFSKLRSSRTIFLHDLLMVPIAWFGAYWLRFNLGVIPEYFWHAALGYLPLVVFVQAVSSWFFGLYRGVWRFASIPDLLRIGKAVLSGTFIVASTLFLYSRLEDVPRSVIPLYAGLLVLLLSTPRFLYRFWKDGGTSARGGGKRTLIVGAGHAGDMLVRDLLSESNAEYNPVIFVDDDKNKRKREIRGIRVVGSIRKIPRLIERFQVDAILIAVPSANDKEMQRIVEVCESCEIPFLTLPSVGEILSGKITREALREVSIDDLLGRDSVKLEWESIRRSLDNKSILVTGGGGSIGSELCRQLAQISLRELIIFEKSEYNLYKIEGELKTQYPDLTVRALLGDVVDRDAVSHMMNQFHPDVVFHAAAYKHVPLLESQAREAVRNNVIGTCNIAQEAIRVGCDKFVLISTDKAVNPTNIMGATKRSAEIFCQTMDSEAGTRFITVRFGNVLGSAGSVVPLFREQIKKGGPVTVTDPNITRFFMTIPEASQLIMEAASVGEGGEIFVLDMGEPIKVNYLAEQMIRLSGKEPGIDVDIEYIGLRPGEKMYEELFHEDENLAETGHSKLFLSKSRESVSTLVGSLPSCLEEACQNFDEEKIREIIKELVPEYRPQSTE
ncbi:MAG: polysaccharide biosynthesis protein [Gammaproteobacteria bacterium]|nr:MAG: polysaccharide biosynthesis protein [Gammaproteobacteria bacterium]